MRIGLLTYHDTTNFGAWLQMFGLACSVSNLGHTIEVVDYQCEEIVRREMPKPLSSCRTPRQLASWLLYGRQNGRKHAVMRRELEEFLQVSGSTYVRQSVGEANAEYDVFLAGSDMLWAPEINGSDPTYLLDFVDGEGRRFAFATSMGAKWSTDAERVASEQLPLFERVALREREGVERVRRVCGVEAEWVCDPTMLLTARDWESMVRRSRYASHAPAENGYVLIYFAYAETSTYEDAVRWAEAHGKKVLFVNSGRPRRGSTNVHPTSVCDFLWLVMHAGAVFTGSYHGLLFALYFEREVCYYGRGSDRFGSVSDRLRIGHRCMDGCNAQPDKPIDYGYVGCGIDEWRRESLAVLRSYWSDCNRLGV